MTDAEPPCQGFTLTTVKCYASLWNFGVNNIGDKNQFSIVINNHFCIWRVINLPPDTCQILKMSHFLLKKKEEEKEVEDRQLTVVCNEPSKDPFLSHRVLLIPIPAAHLPKPGRHSISNFNLKLHIQFPLHLFHFCKRC